MAVKHYKHMTDVRKIMSIIYIYIYIICLGCVFAKLYTIKYFLIDPRIWDTSISNFGAALGRIKAL